MKLYELSIVIFVILMAVGEAIGVVNKPDACKTQPIAVESVK